ncbi:LMBR1-like membrane protein [Citrus sinensis]|uniref:LMBR1-like membrane protein n=1 Tax=Citrus sinensis TaxID=2711 RepID=A0ACB8J597_CITSI|nr:LMBR1-like membrane protein [Citrus sinensis]
MVLMTLRYFAGPEVPRYVLFTVGYTWFCSLSIIILVPADIWTTISNPPHHNENGGISVLWSLSYWSTFLLTWAVVPLIQGFEDAGDFTVTERLRTSVHANLLFYLIVGSIGLFGLILLITMHKIRSRGVLGFAMACSNTFGLVTGAFLLGFGLSEIPKSCWKNADWTTRQKVLSHKIAKMAVKLDDAHQDLSNAIVVAQATSNQMSKRDPLRPYMNVIDDMLTQMFKEDPFFKPQGGRLGENDMDYDTDEKSMATLRRHLRRAREEYYRYKRSLYRKLSKWWFFAEFVWKCILRKQIQKLLAIILGTMSAAILLAEATLLPSGVDLSLFSILVNSVKSEEVFVQLFAFVPLMYMCICTYYSLFKVGMLMFYSLTPRQTSSVNLLMICSMIARYAAPISFNFLNLISLKEGRRTIFEKRMGNIDSAVPFFGEGFNKIYPLIMVIYTLLVASNFFDRVIDFFGSWKRFRFQTEVDDMDGFDPSGLIILQKERSWLEQGRQVGENVVPLARNFNNTDFESGDMTPVEMKATTSLVNDGMKGSTSKPSKEDARKYSTSREAISNKYAGMRELSRQTSSAKPVEQNIASTKVSLLDTGKSSNDTTGGPSSVLASKWESMKTSFRSFRANMGAKRLLPLHQNKDTRLVSRADSSDSESLDEIFQRLKRPSVQHENFADEDDNQNDTK